MKKVKRKQIDFGGTEEQVVRGDGGLDVIDYFYVQLSSENTGYTAFSNESLICNKTALDITTAISNGKTIIWCLKLGVDTSCKFFILLPESDTFTKTSTSSVFSGTLLCTFPQSKNLLRVSITVRRGIDRNNNIIDTIIARATYITGYIPQPQQVDWEQENSSAIDFIKNKPRTGLPDGFYFSNAIQDYDGNWYGAIIIGNKVILAENYRATHAADGTEITYADDPSPIVPLKYRGLFYSKDEVLNGADPNDLNPSGIQGIAPNGWHIPSRSEWLDFENYICSKRRYLNTEAQTNNKDIAKTISSTTYWNASSLEGSPGFEPETNNLSGFNAYPVGQQKDRFGVENNRGNLAIFASTTQREDRFYGYHYAIWYNKTYVNYGSTEAFSKARMSLRCFCDLTPEQFIDWYIHKYGSLQHDIIDEVKLCVETTWSDLTNLINNNGLIPGTKYRITDYNTTTVQTNTISANHPFDLIVTATDVNKLDCKASAVLHENDNYFSTSGSNLSKWEIWYDIENNTTKYDWADNTNGKGVIYRMIDEFGNDCPYDFKNIKFLRNNEYVYTFTYKDLNNPSTLEDYSLNGAKCHNNVIKTFNGNKRTLNHITFLLNSLTDDCHSNTFDCDSHDNTLFDAKYNTFGKECNYNTILQHCNYNTIDSQFASNVLSYNFIGNNIGLNCYGNAFGNNTQYNNIGSNFRDNTVGNNFQNNAVINNVMHCSIGNYFVSSTVGSNCTFSAANYVKNLVVQANNVGFNLDSTDSSTINNEPVYIQNVFITEGCITDGETPIRVTVDRNTIYRTTVAKTSDGTLRIYNEYDPYNAEDIHALPDTTKYGASIYLDFDDTYTEVTDTTNKNPVEEGWFERSGTDPNYVYTLTEDTIPVSGKTYYKAGTYIITATLKDQDGNTLGTPQAVDLPLESVVVDGSYNSTTKNVELVLKNGHSITFSVADLVRGLQTEITLQNPLSADLLVDGTNNKVFSAADKTKLDNIQSGAQVNVKSDWNQTNSSSDDYIKNKPTALSSFTNDVGYLTAADVSASIVWCNYTETDSTNHTGTTSMTISEMQTAIASGYIVCLLLGDLVYTLTSKATVASRFCCVQGATIHSLTYYDSDSLWHYSSTTLQVYLISGTNIKTINNNSILGSGNLNIREIPAANESNNGKMLKIVNGEWTIVPIAPAYHHAGTKIVAQLIPDLLVAANEGNVYNITDTGTTTDYFIEGSGFPIKAGDNVGIAKVEGGYKFDLLSGFVDTSGLALKSEMSITDGTGANADKTTIQLKSGLTKQVLIQHQDISGKANKSEMIITPGTGDDADKVNIQLKSGTSVDVLKTHQDISGKADVNGNYPNMTVGLSQNLDDKVTVEEAFLFRAVPNYKGSISKSVRINEIKGQAIKWNQIGTCIPYTVSQHGVVTNLGNDSFSGYFEASSGDKSIGVDVASNRQRHIVYISFEYTCDIDVSLKIQGTVTTSLSATSTFVKHRTLHTILTNSEGLSFETSETLGENANISVRKYMVIDLTEMFGISSESTSIEDFETWLQKNIGLRDYYHGNSGTILVSKLQSFESIGFNQWDEVWELGDMNPANGETYSSTSRIRTKNYIPVIPNTSYYKKLNDISFYWCFLYDIDKNYITYISWPKNASITIPDNCHYIKFSAEASYGAVYKNGICVNISQENNGTYKQHWHRTINLDVTKITGINPNTGVRERVFPNGMCSVGTTYDRIYEVGGVSKATVAIGKRAYASGDESNASVITDGSITYYVLTTAIAYTNIQDENCDAVKLPLITKASDGGTERVTVKEETDVINMAPILNVEYQLAVDDRLTRLEDIVKYNELEDTFKTIYTGYIIDQRGTITDPITMVSPNYNITEDMINRAFAGILKYSDVAKDENLAGNKADYAYPKDNAISWIRANAHCYVGKWDGTNMRLRQLSDEDKSKFANGNDATAYTQSDSVSGTYTYDVWMKFKEDVYYRCFPLIPTNDVTPSLDLQLVVFVKGTPTNPENWEKFDRNKLIGVYEGYVNGTKALSISGKIATNNISQTDAKAYARNRGTGFKLVDFQANNVVALMFYGIYSTLNSQGVCGSGTYNYDGNTYCPKKTGLCNNLGMTDTDNVNGNGTSSPTVADIQAGYGTTIKSINFLCLENWWGDIYEWMDDLQVMQARRPSSVATANPGLYVDDYINDYIANHSGATGAIINLAGVDTLLTPTDIADSTKFAEDDRFISIRNINGNIVRIINTGLKATKGNIAKCNLGAHGDVFPKALGGSYNVNSYCDYGGVDSVGGVALRSSYAAYSLGGVACLYLDVGAGSSSSGFGFRLLYEGNSTNTIVVAEGDTW